MGFDFNNAPKEKPNAYDNTPIADGLHNVTIHKVDYTTSTNGNKMLKIQFKPFEGGSLIFDQIMDDPTKPLNVFRLGRLLKAAKVTPTGVLELKDIPKILKVGTKLTVATVAKGQYVNIDISKYDGYYPYDTPTMQAPAPTPAVDESEDETPSPQLDVSDTDEYY
jgi:hypothetical protein